MRAPPARPSSAWGARGGRYVVPRQRQFRADLVVVNRCLDELIGLARQCSEPEELEALQQRDYSKARRRPPPPPFPNPGTPRGTPHCRVSPTPLQLGAATRMERLWKRHAAHLINSCTPCP